MTWKKGESGNKSGLSAKDQRLKRMIEEAGPSAVRRIIKAIGSENEAIAVNSSFKLLEYLLGKPKQQATLDVNVTSTQTAHLLVLDELARAKLGTTLDLAISQNTNEIKMIEGGET